MEIDYSQQNDSKDIKIYNLERRIHALTVDTVTNLLKKEGFNDRVREKDEDVLEVIKNPFAAVIIDFDKFKRINTLYGHNKGDIYLNKISGEIDKIIWEEGGIVFRWKEGDELAALLPIKGEKEQVFEEYRQTIDKVSTEINGSLKIIGQDFVIEGMPEASKPSLTIGSILSNKGIDIKKESNSILNDVYGLMDKADVSMMSIKELPKSDGENVKYNLYENLNPNNEKK